MALQDVSSTEAALVYSLEPVSGALMVSRENLGLEDLSWLLVRMLLPAAIMCDVSSCALTGVCICGETKPTSDCSTDWQHNDKLQSVACS